MSAEAIIEGLERIKRIIEKCAPENIVLFKDEICTICDAADEYIKETYFYDN